MTIDGKEEPLSRGATASVDAEETPDQAAFGIANGWIKYRAERGTPVAGKNMIHRIKSGALTLLDAGYTKNEIKTAMANLGEALPSTAMMQRELDRMRTGRRLGRQDRRREARRAGAHVEDEWSDVRPGAAGQVAYAASTGGVAT